MSVCVKYAAAHFSTIELVFYRSFLGCVLVLIIARFRRKTLLTQNIRTHFWRSITGFISLCLFFYALPLLHLPASMALLQTSPLFLAFLTAAFLREQPPRLLVFLLLVSFLGMLLVLRPLPTIMAIWQSTADKNESIGELMGGLAALGAGIMAGCAYFNIRRLGVMNEGGVRTVFYFTLICTILSAPLLPFSALSPLTPVAIGWVVVIGITATAGQLALTRGLHSGKTAVSAALMYTSVIFAGVFDYVLWDNIPAPLSWLGIVMICVAGAGAMLHNPKTTHHEKTATIEKR